ncbi:hypothetical protein KC669_02010 [Candidatus Dojkabacteria bacterium]|uniref:Type II toxin-antitoxin system Phd/YefM family antitoxin n=1 Tax=Candidatus Dojkabacteria bacterium TaxID=2099670 RepID=A0A955RLX6_9BACT|nr:hypothetical protein [Candidatus Dojkabacteria bacterium]
MKTYTTTALRANLYKVIDYIIETGNSVAVEKDNQTVIINKLHKKKKLDNLTKNQVLPPNTSLDEVPNLQTFDINTEWKEGQNLE